MVLRHGNLAGISVSIDLAVGTDLGMEYGLDTSIGTHILLDLGREKQKIEREDGLHH